VSLAFGLWLLVFGFWSLAVGFWVLGSPEPEQPVSSFLTRKPKAGVLGSGFWVIGSWFWVLGSWLLVIGDW
jgi:hypothetical protein